jgi:hypothetical protein
MALGFENLTLINVMNGYCSTAGAMMQYACMAIREGLAKTVVLVCADAPQARIFTISLIHRSIPAGHAVPARNGGAEAPLPARCGQGTLVPGILGAEFRLRPRVVAHKGGS